VGEVEIGEDREAVRHGRAKEEAYLRHRALADAVLERGERLLDHRLQARDDRLVEAVAARLGRPPALASAPRPFSAPAPAEPVEAVAGPADLAAHASSRGPAEPTEARAAPAPLVAKVRRLRAQDP
jgi:hypothetical protein